MFEEEIHFGLGASRNVMMGKMTCGCGLLKVKNLSFSIHGICFISFKLQTFPSMPTSVLEKIGLTTSWLELGDVTSIYDHK